MQKQVEEVAKAQRRLPKIEAEMQTAEVTPRSIQTVIRPLTHTRQAQFQLASDAVVQYEREFSGLGDIDHLTRQRDELQEKMRVNRGKIGNFKVHLHHFLFSFCLTRCLLFRMTKNK